MPDTDLSLTVNVRQRPETVQVVRQAHAGQHIEGPTTPDRHKCPPQHATSARIHKEFPTTMRHHREKTGRTILAPSDVIWHSWMLSMPHGGANKCSSGLARRDVIPSADVGPSPT